jgi:methionyl-tRNA synthetase
MSTFYVTTPIYYVNGAPHLGHAYTTIVADAMARHYRQRGDDVFFLTGTDEHGLKVQRSAEEQGVSPQELCDRNSEKFKALFDRMDLTYDRFIRTTEPEHEEVVLEIVERMKANDDVYLDTYEGWYAPSDEAYYDESEIEDGVAISSGSEVEWVEEDSYFFRLSDYEDDLLEWYDEMEGCVAPDSRLNEVRSFVEGGLTDLSITRTSFDWGIEWPDDPNHVLYVWIDALTNYLTGIEFGEDGDRFERFWPCDMHLVGKDILRFHAVYWPAMLMSVGIEPPKGIFAHGWWLVEGEKMSKSKGNWVSADDLLDEYDLDVVRYFLLREIPLGQDGNFAASRIVERNNTELADNFGNLVNRTCGMLDSFTDGWVPGPPSSVEPVDADLADAARQARRDVAEAMDERMTHEAVEAAMTLSRHLNNYIQQTAPWRLNGDGEQERLEAVLYNIVEGIRWVAVLMAAFTPDSARAVLELLLPERRRDDALAFETLEWGLLEGDFDLEAPPVLFEKLDPPEDDEDDMTDTEKEDTDEETAEAEDAGLIDFDHFTDVEFAVGEILDAKPVEGADKLLKLTVDLGEAEPRTVVAGIANSYDPDELEGLRLTFVTNLEPANLFGIESQAMLLAATDDDGNHVLATYPKTVNPGASVG